MDKTILDIIIKAKDEASSTIKKASGNMSQMGKTAEHLAAGASVALLGIGVVSVKMAATFQESMTQLVTGAGESEKNIKMVSAGILQLAVSTGTSTQQLSSGMYMIESAGYHGAAGLKVLKAAAEGARVGNADLGSVSNALTSILNAYHISASNATNVTNEMVATVAAGKMHMQDLANAISAVLPVAAAAHVSFAQVGGAIATMTAQGMSAQQASQDLANTIRSLQNPNAVAVNEMQQLGLNSNQVAMNLGKKGLTGTIQLLTRTITNHMGASGQVIMNAFNQSTSAAQDANIMIQQMPGSIQGMARAYMNGSTSMAQWRLEMQMATPLNRNLMQQFGTLADKSKGFNSLLKSGLPAAQTYTAALAKMMGGATGLNTALMLGGSNMPNFTANVNSVASAARKGGQNVHGWSLIQKDFNFKMDQAKEALNTTGIAVGTALLPPLTALLKMVLKIVQPIAEWTSKHEKLTAIIFGSLTAITGLTAGILMAYSSISKVKTALTVAKDAMIALKENTIIASIASKAYAAAQWLVNAAMDANPIGIIIVAIGALIAVTILIITHWKQVAAFFTRLWADVMSLFKSKIGFILAALFPFIGIPLLIAAHWRSIVSFFEGLWNDVSRGVVGFVGTIIRFFEQLPGNILKALGNLGNLLFNSGKDIIQGLVNGITNLASTPINAIKKIGSDVVTGFKSLLGIHSPSTVFAEAGLNIGQGLIVGIQRSAASVKTAVNGLVPTTINPKITGATNSSPNTTAAQSNVAPQSAGGGMSFSVGAMTVNIHGYAGTQSDKQKVAVEIWQSLMQVARSHNMAGNVPNLGIRPV